MMQMCSHSVPVDRSQSGKTNPKDLDYNRISVVDDMPSGLNKIIAVEKQYLKGE